MGKNNTYSVEIMKNSINATNGYKDITIKNTDLVNSRFVDEILDVFFRIEGDALVDEDVEIIKNGIETVNSRFKDLSEESLKKDITAFNASFGDLVDKVITSRKWGENKERNENIKKAIERGVENFDKLSLEDSKKAWEEMSTILFKKKGVSADVKI